MHITQRLIFTPSLVTDSKHASSHYWKLGFVLSMTMDLNLLTITTNVAWMRTLTSWIKAILFLTRKQHLLTDILQQTKQAEEISKNSWAPAKFLATYKQTKKYLKSSKLKQTICAWLSFESFILMAFKAQINLKNSYNKLSSNETLAYFMLALSIKHKMLKSFPVAEKVVCGFIDC